MRPAATTLAAAVTLAVLSLATASCGGDDDSGSESSELVCDPGRTESCACPGGGEGAQACLEDGSGFDTCDCGASCADQDTVCGTLCADVTSDAENCGACGNACDSDERCDDGDCVLDCDNEDTGCDGACVDLEQDEDNCGACGVPCRSGEVCADGECEVAACSVDQTECPYIVEDDGQLAVECCTALETCTPSGCAAI